MSYEEVIAYFEKKRKRAHPCDVKYYDIALNALRNAAASDMLQNKTD